MIRIVVALAAEAGPMLARLRERGPLSSHEGSFPFYRGEDVALVVSGIGKTAAAAAAGYLHAITAELGVGAWLNFGVAGHRDAELGRAFLAHKVRDQASGESWYPPRLLDVPIETGRILTVDRVERDFDESWIYDMEASGFHSAASRFATAELVHSMKIISDNRERPPEGMTARRIASLVEARVEAICPVLQALEKLAAETRRLAAPPPELGRFVRHWRFTVSERRRLRRLLQRWHALTRDPAYRDDLEELPRARDVLRDLETRLDALPLCIDPVRKAEP